MPRFASTTQTCVEFQIEEFSFRVSIRTVGSQREREKYDQPYSRIDVRSVPQMIHFAASLSLCFVCTLYTQSTSQMKKKNKKKNSRKIKKISYSLQ